MKKLSIFSFFLIGLIPSVHLSASQQTIDNNIKNWFEDDYWIKQYKDIDEATCNILKENFKDLKGSDCLSRNSVQKKVDSDFIRKVKCENFIEEEFKTIKRSKTKQQIIDDCKRIYNSYKDKNGFINEGFSSFYVSFALNKELPFYEGEYLNGKQHGKGNYYYKNGHVYIGDYKDDFRNGEGTFYFINGNKYVGNWLNNNYHGEGTFYYKNGSKYSGNFVKGKFEGKGTYYFKSGNKYVGDWLNNKRNGKGTYYFKSGNKYVGDWLNNKRNGKGDFIWQDGDKYSGDWLNDKIHGFGTYYFSENGNKYIGYWLNSKRNGEGIFFNKKEEILKQGIWENNSLLISQKVNLKELITSKDATNDIEKSNHESCLKASDYKGCMNYKEGNTSKIKPIKITQNVDCVNSICSPEEAKVYGTDNLGQRVLPGYYFKDIPEKRAVNYISKPLKLNVNGSYGRYVHIQRIIRYYSDGYSGSFSTSPGYSAGAPPIINYSPGQASGIRQMVQNHVFDCEEKTYARYKKNRLMSSETKSGRRKKWVKFEEGGEGYTSRKGIEACQKSQDYILSLDFSPFKKFEGKKPKSTAK